MEWLQANWTWLLVVLVCVGMHMGRGHGGHRDHGRQGGGSGDRDRLEGGSH